MWVNVTALAGIFGYKQVGFRFPPFEKKSILDLLRLLIFLYCSDLHKFQF